LCAAKSPKPKGLTIPSLTIRSGPDGTTVEPKLMATDKGIPFVRSLNVTFRHYGLPAVVTAELLPPETIMLLQEPVLLFTMEDEAGRQQEIVSMTLRDGTTYRFG